MVRNRKEKPEKVKRVLSKEEADISEVLTGFAKKITGDENLHIEYRDMSDNRGMTAMVRKNKIIIGKNSGPAFTTELLYATCSAYKVLGSLDVPERFLAHGINFWDEQRSTGIWKKYNEIKAKVTKEVLNSDGYKVWMNEVSGFEMKRSPTGEKFFYETQRPSPNEIAKKSVEWGKKTDDAIDQHFQEDFQRNLAKKIDHWNKVINDEVSIETSKIKDAKLAPLLSKISDKIYASTFIPLNQEHKNDILSGINTLSHNAKQTREITGKLSMLSELYRETPDDNSSVSISLDEIRNNSEDIAKQEPPREDDLNLLLKDLYCAGEENDEILAKLAELKKTEDEARQSGKLEEFVERVIELVCDKPGEREKAITDKAQQPDAGKTGDKEPPPESKTESGVIFYKNGNVETFGKTPSVKL